MDLYREKVTQILEAIVDYLDEQTGWVGNPTINELREDIKQLKLLAVIKDD